MPTSSDNQNARPAPAPAYVRLTGPSSDGAFQPLESTCACEPPAVELEEDQTSERAGIRLLMALLMILGLGAVGLVLALVFNIVVPPVMWLAMVAMLIIGVIAGGVSEDPKPKRSASIGDGDGARPVGCCSGPRPLQSFRER